MACKLRYAHARGLKGTVALGYNNSTCSEGAASCDGRGRAAPDFSLGGRKDAQRIQNPVVSFYLQRSWIQGSTWVWYLR